MYVWDADKSAANQCKHGISFEQARDHIFEGRNLLAVGVAHQGNEIRHAVIGTFDGHYYVAIFTMRSDAVRIISVRRARDEEKRTAKVQGL